MMFTRQKLLRDVLAVGAVSAIVLFQSISTSNAQEQNQNGSLDHFKCYFAEGDNEPPTVDLEDQFGIEENVFGIKPWLKPRMLCNPVTKRHDDMVFPIRHPEEHLVCYRIKPKTADKTVIVANQFGTQKLHVGKSRFLCVPSQKYIVQDHGQINEVEVRSQPDCDFDQSKCPLDHFKCYFVDNQVQPQRIKVGLIDQFMKEEVKVLRPRMLCNPAIKWHEGKEVPVRYPEKHLMCYEIDPKTETAKTVIVANQFGTQKLQVGKSRFLCVPSEKYEVQSADEDDD